MATRPHGQDQNQRTPFDFNNEHACESNVEWQQLQQATIWSEHDRRLQAKPTTAANNTNKFAFYEILFKDLLCSVVLLYSMKCAFALVYTYYISHRMIYPNVKSLPMGTREEKKVHNFHKQDDNNVRQQGVSMSCNVQMKILQNMRI